MRVAIHFEPEVRELFEANGAECFDQLMNGGACIGNGPKSTRCTVERVSLADGSRYFIKRSGRLSPLVQLRSLLAGGGRCGPLREKQLLDRLRLAGFETMKPVAWGEKRAFGLSVAGFLIVREVTGREVAAEFDRISSDEKRKLMEDVGRLVGRLHVRGFFQPVRLKDLIHGPGGLTLIDRETTKFWPSRFSLRKCEILLARSLRRTLRDKHKIGAGSANAFLTGYMAALAERAAPSRSLLRSRIVKRLRSTLPA